MTTENFLVTIENIKDSGVLYDMITALNNNGVVSCKDIDPLHIDLFRYWNDKYTDYLKLFGYKGGHISRLRTKALHKEQRKPLLVRRNILFKNVVPYQIFIYCY